MRLGWSTSKWDTMKSQGDGVSSTSPATIRQRVSTTKSSESPLGGRLFLSSGGLRQRPDPTLAALNLQRAAEATGKAEFKFRTEVTAVLREGKNGAGKVRGIRFADGTEAHAPVVINVAGPHSSHITEMAFAADPKENDMRITTRAMRQEVAYVEAPVDAKRGENGELEDFPFSACGDSGVYFHPEVGGKLVIGSLEPDCDAYTHEFPVDPEAVYPGNDMSSLTDQWTSHVYRAALRMPSLPIPNSTNTKGITACYDVTEVLGPNLRPLCY